MSTRNIVPRNDGEGNLGTATKKWNGMYTNTLNGRNVDNDGKKLDETRDGLTVLENDVSTIKGTVTSMDNTIINHTNAINSLKAAVGSPLTAKTVAEMNDKSKIYVYTGTEDGYIKGNWYYNNGSSWVSGGVYNSIAFETDTTLTVSKQAADAKVTGCYIRAMYSNKKNIVKGDHFETWDAQFKNTRIVSRAIYATKGTVIHLLSPKYCYRVNDGEYTQEDTVIDKDGEIKIMVSKVGLHDTTPDASFESVDEIENIVTYLVPAYENKDTDEALKALYKNINIVKGDHFETWDAQFKNTRIVSKPIYATKGTIIHLLSSQYYYRVNDGEYTQEDTVIDKDGEIKIMVSKVGLHDTTPDVSFESVDEIENIVTCLVPTNYNEAYEAIKMLQKSINSVKGDHFETWDAQFKNTRIVSRAIYATKGTVIHLLSPKYCYRVNDGDTQEDTVIDKDGEIKIMVSKVGLHDTTPDMSFKSVDEIENIVFCLVPENESKENKELVRQAKHSSENNYGENLATPVFSLLHLSDIHADVDALKRIVEKSSEYKLDDMICTGDMVSTDASESIADWWEPRILTCIGNHDVTIITWNNGIITSADWSKLTMQERDTKYISPFISQWGSVTHESGTSYYFKDYPDKKVRLVVVDIMLYYQRSGSTSHETESAKQTQWLEETLQSAINLDYHVVIATHYPLLGAIAKECSFSPYGSDGKPFFDDAFTTILQDTVDKYIQKGLHFVCYLSGHVHTDAVVYVDKSTKQIQVLVTCAHTKVKNVWSKGDQYRGPNDDAMNVVCVDTYHNLLKLVRIGGANIDACMRPRKAICINYKTGVVVGEVK